MVDLTKNIVAFYKMNETSGLTVVDSSGNGYNGTSANTVTPVAGKINGALSFNGTSDYIDTGQTFQSVFQSDFSISCWVQIGDYDDEEAIYGILSNTYEFGSVNLTHNFDINNNPNFQFRYKLANQLPSAQVRIYGDPMNIGVAWHHIVVVAKQTTSTTANFFLYDNNVLVGSSSKTNFVMSNYQNSNNFLVGQVTDINGLPIVGLYFEGSLDDMPIFNKALSQEEMDFLWNGGAGTEQLTDAVVNCNDMWLY